MGKRIVIVCAMCLLVLTLSSTSLLSPNDVVVINPYFVSEVSVTSKDHIVVTFGWVACSRGLTQDFLDSVSYQELVVDGKQVFESFDAHRDWSAIEPSDISTDNCVWPVDTAWGSRWNKKIGRLSVGDHMLVYTMDWSHPVIDGLDSNADGIPEIYDWPLTVREVIVHVVAP